MAAISIPASEASSQVMTSQPSIFSSFLANVESKIREVFYRLTQVPEVERAKVEADAQNMLKACRLGLLNVKLPYGTRDLKRQQGYESCFIDIIDTPENVTRIELEKCDALISEIDRSGLDLSGKLSITTCQQLTWKIKELSKYINALEARIKSSTHIPKLLCELGVAREFKDMLTQLANLILKYPADINCFSYEDTGRLIEMARQTNTVAWQVFDDLFAAVRSKITREAKDTGLVVRQKRVDVPVEIVPDPIDDGKARNTGFIGHFADPKGRDPDLSAEETTERELDRLEGEILALIATNERSIRNLSPPKASRVFIHPDQEAIDKILASNLSPSQIDYHLIHILHRFGIATVDTRYFLNATGTNEGDIIPKVIHRQIAERILPMSSYFCCYQERITDGQMDALQAAFITMRDSLYDLGGTALALFAFKSSNGTARKFAPEGMSPFLVNAFESCGISLVDWKKLTPLGKSVFPMTPDCQLGKDGTACLSGEVKGLGHYQIFFRGHGSEVESQMHLQAHAFIKKIHMLGPLPDETSNFLISACYIT